MNLHPTKNSPSTPVMIFKESLETATKRIPPLWPLSRFVAVNPFVGLAKMDFASAAALLKNTTGTSLAMPPAFYRERYRSGLITGEDLQKALDEAAAGTQGKVGTINDLISALESEFWELHSHHALPLPSFTLDATQGSRWASFIAEEISKWCTAYFDEGQALWSLPWKGMPLFSAWKEASALDRNPEIAGIAGWRDLVANLSEDPTLVVEEIALSLRLPEQEATDIFHALLLSINGWAGHLQFLTHEKQLRGEREDSLRDLLAIRMVYELALQRILPNDTARKNSASQPRNSGANTLPSTELLWQRAHEYAMQRSLFEKLAARDSSAPDLGESKDAVPAFQAVFCIDVRSEIYRRSLEKIAPEGQTIGFAGFFGFPIEAIRAGETAGPPQCPVLLKPAVRVFEHASTRNLEAIGFLKRVTNAWKSFKSSAVSSFVFVELAGLGFLPKMLRDLFHWPHATSSPLCGCDVDVDAIPMETQIAMAAGALRHMGLVPGGLSRIILLCGHGSSTENNPYGSSLDCGACGGHSGEANARTAVAILNNPEVRSGLLKMGIVIPEETRFLAGLHNTTTDEVTLFDKESAPVSHAQEIDVLEARLAKAGAMARKDRAPLLGLNPLAPDLDKLIADRSRDWSQVRPEWGLAGNYAFVAAPRKLTRGIDLSGRVFLHDYSFEKDEGEATLELLLCAPVVVASWINLQYYASTVDNQRFGSGDKTIHNVAGVVGILEGNAGDIRTGLPFQSVHDGQQWMHEPLRLHVCVKAPKEAIDRILEKHPSVADLVSNKWIHLFAISENTAVFEKSDGRGNWSSVA